MKRTQHSGCFILFIELDCLNFALDTDADFDWLNAEQLYLDVSVYSNTGIEKFSWGRIRIRICYSTNSKVNIRILQIRIFFHFITSLLKRWCIALYGKPITELQSVTCHMESHSVICHSTPVNMPHLNFSQTGRYSTTNGWT